MHCRKGRPTEGGPPEGGPEAGVSVRPGATACLAVARLYHTVAHEHPGPATNTCWGNHRLVQSVVSCAVRQSLCTEAGARPWVGG